MSRLRRALVGAVLLTVVIAWVAFTWSQYPPPQASLGSVSRWLAKPITDYVSPEAWEGGAESSGNSIVMEPAEQNSLSRIYKHVSLAGVQAQKVAEAEGASGEFQLTRCMSHVIPPNQADVIALVLGPSKAEEYGQGWCSVILQLRRTNPRVSITWIVPEDLASAEGSRTQSMRQCAACAGAEIRAADMSMLGCPGTLSAETLRSNPHSMVVFLRGGVMIYDNFLLLAHRVQDCPLARTGVGVLPGGKQGTDASLLVFASLEAAVKYAEAGDSTDLLNGLNTYYIPLLECTLRDDSPILCPPPRKWGHPTLLHHTRCTAPTVGMQELPVFAVDFGSLALDWLPNYMSWCPLWSETKAQEPLSTERQLGQRLLAEFEHFQAINEPYQPYGPQGFRRTPSYPLTSGDGFRMQCRFRCGGEGCSIDPNDVQAGDCIYAEMTNMQNFESTYRYSLSVLDLLNSLRGPVVLITHNGDISIPDGEDRPHEPGWPREVMSPMLSHPNLQSWFASNCRWEAWETTPKPDNLICIPIGVENMYHRIGGAPREYFEAMIERPQIEPTRLLLLPFHEENAKPDRMLAMRHFLGKQWAQPLNGVNHRDFLREVQRSKFVACPFGHGMDTHRLWEVLYAGGFAVLRHSSMDSQYDGLPVLLVDQWTDVTPELLEAKYLEFKERSDFKMYRLFMPYWESLVLKEKWSALASWNSTTLYPFSEFNQGNDEVDPACTE